MVEDTHTSHPSPAETLRRAASEIRDYWSSAFNAWAKYADADEQAFHLAVADWLESIANRRTNARYASFGAKDADWNHATTVARAYLGGDT